MEISADIRSSWVILTFVGRIDSFNYESFNEKLGTLISMGKKRIALDLSQVNFVNLQSLLFVLQVSKKLSDQNGCLALIGANEFTTNTLQEFRRSSLINFFEKHEDFYAIRDNAQ